MEWDSLELDLWIEHYQRRPFGDNMQDQRMAQLAYYIVSCMSTGKKKVHLKDFVPQFKRSDLETKEQSLRDSIGVLNILGRK